MAQAKCAKCGASFEQIRNGRRKYCDDHASRSRNPNNKPTPPAVISTVATAATQGRRALLEALRATIAQQIDNGVPARDLASLSKRLVDISEELDALTAQEEGDDIAEATNTPDEEWTPSGGAQARPA